MRIGGHEQTDTWWLESSLGQQDFSEQDFSKHGSAPVTQNKILFCPARKRFQQAENWRAGGIPAPSASQHREEQGSASTRRFFALAQHTQAEAVDAKTKWFLCSFCCCKSSLQDMATQHHIHPQSAGPVAPQTLRSGRSPAPSLQVLSHGGGVGKQPTTAWICRETSSALRYKTDKYK